MQTGTTPGNRDQAIAVHVPPKGASGRSLTKLTRRRSYVSAYTTEFDVTINALAAIVFPIDRTQPYCSAAGDGGLDCTLSVVLPAGNDTIVISSFDNAHRLLSAGSTTTVVDYNSLPQIVVNLGAVVDHASILPTAPIFKETKPGASSQTSTLQIIADDVDNYQIDGPFTVPIVVASRNQNATSISLSASSFTASTDQINVTYSGGTESTGFVFDAINSIARVTPAEIFLDCGALNQTGDYSYSTKVEVADEFDPSPGEHICQIDGAGGSPNEEGPNGFCTARIVRGQCPNVYDTYSNSTNSGNQWSPMTASYQNGEEMSLSESLTANGGPQCIRLSISPTVGNGRTMKWVTDPVPHDLGTTETLGRVLFLDYVNPSDETPQGLQARPQECSN